MTPTLPLTAVPAVLDEMEGARLMGLIVSLEIFFVFVVVIDKLTILCRRRGEAGVQQMTML